MSHPEDRVLVAAITRRKDLRLARDSRWYRIPRLRMPEGVATEYLAFFTSARVAGRERGGIYWYARLGGVELQRRRDLLPEESLRADELYYRLQLGDWCTRAQPVLNPEGRVFAFLHSTWDRFCQATRISDLTSRAPGYVRRDLPLRPPRRRANLRADAGSRRPLAPAFPWRTSGPALLDADCLPHCGPAH